MVMSATNGPGMRRLTRGHRRTIARLPTATSTAAGFSDPMWDANARHFPRKSTGTTPIGSPRKSFTSPEKMIRAIPLVKPSVTGYGMNLIAPPSPRRPNASSMPPAISVATVRPSRPYFCTTA